MNAEMMKEAAAAEYLGAEVNTLRNWRCTKRYALPFVKIGRLVFYRKPDLDKWIESRVVRPLGVEG